VRWRRSDGTATLGCDTGDQRNDAAVRRCGASVLHWGVMLECDAKVRRWNATLCDGKATLGCDAGVRRWGATLDCDARVRLCDAGGCDAGVRGCGCGCGCGVRMRYWGAALGCDAGVRHRGATLDCDARVRRECDAGVRFPNCVTLQEIGGKGGIVNNPPPHVVV
jgi:hypothetical protein